MSIETVIDSFRGRLNNSNPPTHSNEVVMNGGIVTSDSHFRIIAESVSDLICVVDIGGTVRYANPSLTRILGWTPQEFIGKKSLDYVHPDDKDTVRAMRQRTIEVPRDPVRFEVRYRRSDGNYCWLECCNTNMLHVEGIEGFLVTYRDTTERKESKAASALLAALVELTYDAVSSADIEGFVTTWNSAAERLYGYSRSEMIGQHISRIFADESKEEMTAIRKAVSSGKAAFNKPVRLRHKSGKLLDVALTLSPVLNNAGEVVGLSGITRDISEEKKADKALRLTTAAIEVATSPILICDAQSPDMEIVYVNPAFERLTGYTKEEVIGRNCRFLQGGDLGQTGVHDIRNAIAHRQTTHVLLRNYRKDGSLFWNELFLSPIFGEDGELTHFVGIQNDITERKNSEDLLKQAKDSLQEANDLFQGIMEASSDLIAAVGTDRRFLLFNDSYRDASPSLFQKSAKMNECVDAAFSAGTTNDRIMLGLWDRALTGEDFSVSIELGESTADRKWFEITFTTIRDYTGEQIGASHVMRDITKRRIAEDALLESEAVLSSFYNSSDMYMGTIEVFGNEIALVSVNATAAKLFGIDAKSKDIRLAEIGISPEDHVIWLTECIKSRQFGHAVRFDYEIDCPSGFPAWLSVVVSFIGDSPTGSTQYTFIAEDITDQKQAESSLHDLSALHAAILDGSSYSIVATDEKGVVRVLNPAAEEMTGYSLTSSSDEICLQQLFESIESQRVGTEKSRFQSLVTKQKQRSEKSGDWKCIRKDGTTLPVTLTVTPLHNKEGELRGYLAISQDITQQKLIETQMLQTEKLAALGELVAGVAHELNNPLAAISAGSQLLEMHPDPEVQEDAKTIRAMTDRATKIVRSLLTFSRRGNDDQSEVDLNEVVQASVELAKFRLASFEVNIATELDPDSALAMANECQIQQILINLITNAEHALMGPHNGERTIKIKTFGFNAPDDRKMVAVSVEDNGTGIAPDVLPKIFDPFFTTKDVGQGTGLGLSICHGIATSHGGDISVESVVGQGTKFTLTLPATD